MKNKNLILIFTLTIAITFTQSCSNNTNNSSSETEEQSSVSVDSTVEVTAAPEVISEPESTEKVFTEIGGQTWLTKNLDVSTFRNGDSIQEAQSPEEWLNAGKEGKPAWCYCMNNPEFGKMGWGKLYNWFAVNDSRGLAPEGWHIPTRKEWQILTDYLGFWHSKKMRANEIWKVGEVAKGDNESGFNALPAGHRVADKEFGGYSESPEGSFKGGYTYAYWWSSTGTSSLASYIILDRARAEYYDGTTLDGLSVRCIMD